MKIIRKFVQDIIFCYIPPIALMGVIYLLSAQSSIPTGQTTLIDFFIKKIAHLTEYALLYFLWVRALKQSGKLNRWLFCWAFVITFVYALSDEFHQSFVPNRSPRLTDISIDTLGMIISYLRINKFV
jgi:VanZ family protein